MNERERKTNKFKKKKTKLPVKDFLNPVSQKNNLFGMVLQAAKNAGENVTLHDLIIQETTYKSETLPIKFSNKPLDEDINRNKIIKVIQTETGANLINSDPAYNSFIIPLSLSKHYFN